jgi:hypothetical protein
MIDHGYDQAKSDYFDNNGKNPTCPGNYDDSLCTSYRLGYEAGWLAQNLLHNNDQPREFN